jgi:hypothetical protein
MLAPGTNTYVADPIPPLDPVRQATLAERAHRILDGGTPRPDSKYQRRELALHALSAYEAQQNEVQFRNAQALQNDFIARTKLEKEWYFDDLKIQSEFGSTAEEFIVPFISPVHTDKATDLDYCDLPQELLTLRRYERLPGDGVYDVLPLLRADRRRAPFLPLKGSQNSLVRDLFKNGLEGQYQFWRQGTRLLFDCDPGMVRPSKRWEQLEILCVIRRRETDELPAPALLQAAQDFDILARMLKLAMKVMPEDKVNDNNATVQ